MTRLVTDLLEVAALVLFAAAAAALLAPVSTSLGLAGAGVVLLIGSWLIQRSDRAIA